MGKSTTLKCIHLLKVSQVNNKNTRANRTNQTQGKIRLECPLLNRFICHKPKAINSKANEVKTNSGLKSARHLLLSTTTWRITPIFVEYKPFNT